jgi:hypothetical protein
MAALYDSRAAKVRAAYPSRLLPFNTFAVTKKEFTSS